MKAFKVTFYSLLFILILAFSGCAKKNPNIATSLHGSWAEASIHASNIRRLHFDTNGTFGMELRTSVEHAITMTGTYQVTDNKLRVNITKHLVSAYGKPDEVIVVNEHQLYENCTFIVKGDILTLNYTTYPADAPVSTQATFTRTNLSY